VRRQAEVMRGARIRVTKGAAIGPDRARLAAGIITSVLAGFLIGRLDSGAGWDDTGVTAALLVVAAGIASFIAGQRPWLFAVTTGMFVPLFELPGLAGGGALAAFLFSSIGAFVGWFAARR
jgi:hypothetical protein